jgi:rod shape determining protein RodA
MNILNNIWSRIKHIDWILLGAVLPIVLFGIVTMNSFVKENDFASRQFVWLLFSLILFFILSLVDWRFLRRTYVVIFIYFFTLLVLGLLFGLGQVFKGARSWFDLGFFAFQPVEFAKIALIILLAKYFSRRHIEIRNIRHILVSGTYALLVFGLVFFQPDLGSSVIIFSIWFGMVMVSGLSKKHFFLVIVIISVSFLGMWNFVLKDYQKDRVMNLLQPLNDIHGSGYNAYQSMITVGSGMLLGKGVGYGTQSRLEFLPEYETDFIFAAFGEEWGFFGVVILLFLYSIVIWRILINAVRGQTNFETLFCVGVAIMFSAHFIIHIGMNIGILPVTGLTLPFMSYGGTHLLASFFSLGIIMGMRKYMRPAHRDIMRNEFIGF